MFKYLFIKWGQFLSYPVEYVIIFLVGVECGDSPIAFSETERGYVNEYYGNFVFSYDDFYDSYIP